MFNEAFKVDWFVDDLNIFFRLNINLIKRYSTNMPKVFIDVLHVFQTLTLPTYPCIIIKLFLRVQYLKTVL